MPRNIYIPEGLSEPLSRGDFVRGQRKKARVQRRTRKKFRNLVGIRSIRLVIRESAAGRKYMMMRYKKATTGENKKYKVANYSFRFKRDKDGRRRKMLFAFDFKDRHIKGFYVRNIKSVERTNSNFRPVWPIEIALR